MAASIPVVVAFVVSRSVVDPTAALAENDCFRIGPAQIRDVIGSTWSGRLEAVHEDRSNPEISRLVFHVDHVYAGQRSTSDRDHLRLEPDEDLTLEYSRCPDSATPPDIGLDPGRHYLLSQRGGPSPDALLTSNTVIWQIRGHDVLDYQDFYDQPSDIDSTFRSTGTLSDALALVVPGLPPTDTARPTSDGVDASARYVLMGVLAAAGSIWWRRHTRRSGRSHAQPH